MANGNYIQCACGDVINIRGARNGAIRKCACGNRVIVSRRDRDADRVRQKRIEEADRRGLSGGTRDTYLRYGRY